MKLSLQMTMAFGALFGLACLAVAVTGFVSLDEIADPQLRADARGYAWFWALLGMVGFAAAATGWWLARGSASASAGKAMPQRKR
jgi:hypothetical protein